MTQAAPLRIGIIDLGSNTGRLIVMQAIPGYSFRLADEIREVVRLRAGMTDEGLSPEAIDRALFTLRLFRGFCSATEVDVLIATATSAVREAPNGAEFVERVRQDIGIELEVLGGEREAYYGVLGALNEIPMTEGLVIDIGGGSAQVSQVKNRGFVQGTSRRLGALALTEQFVRSDPISKDAFKAIELEIEHQLDTIDWLETGSGTLAGVGGTIRNLAKIEAKRIDFPLNTLHGFTLTRDSVEESIDLFRSLHQNDRENIPGLNSDRADIILPGAMVLLAFMERLEQKQVAVSVNGLREGVFFERFWQHLPTPVIPDVRRFSILNMARIYDYQKEHANHVRHLAERVFDQLQGLHPYGKPERELLDAAALLHDLGTIIQYDDHHKHSQTLIDNSGLPGFTPRETALIALMARFHRKGRPAIDDYSEILDSDDEELLVKLAAILRLAEYLERGRNGAVSDVSIQWDDRTLNLSLLSDIYPAVELWQARRLAIPLMEEAFEREVLIHTVAAPSAEWES